MALTIEWEDGRPVARRGDREVGRVEVILEEPVIGYLVNPRVVEGEDPVELSRALLAAGAAGARPRGCARVEVILEDRIPHFDALSAAMEVWGHPVIRTKLLFALAAEDLPELPSGELRFSPVEGAEDPRLPAILREVFDDGATAAREGQTAEELMVMLVNLCRLSDPDAPASWELGLIEGEPVGAVLPGFIDPGVGSNLFVGVVPAARGSGYGLRLHHRGLATCARRGAKRLLGSTETDNEPMVRVFRRLGYEQKLVQRYFEWRGSGAAMDAPESAEIG